MGLKENFWSEKFWVRKKFEFNFFGPVKFLVSILGVLIKFGVLKKFCPRIFWSTKILNKKKLGPKSLLKIVPVTAEILLIWTNVTRAYVARTNVTLTVGIF